MTIGSESEKASYTEAGLFGSVGKGAAIRNVGVINAAIYNKTTTDPSVGLLAGRDQREQHRRELLGDRHDLQRYDFSLLFLRRRPRRQHRHQEPHLQQLDERCRLCQGQL